MYIVVIFVQYFNNITVKNQSMYDFYIEIKKDYDKAIDRLLHSTIKTVKTISTRDEFAGVYIIKQTNSGEIVWVGESENIPNRMKQHMYGNGDSTLKKLLPIYPKYSQKSAMYKVQHRMMKDKIKRKNFEKYVTSVLNPTFNK